MSAFQFNVSQLLKSGIGTTREYDFASEEPFDLDDGVASHDLRGHVRFTLTNFSILAAVQVRAILDLVCARCLEPFPTPTTVSFEEEYQPEIDVTTGLPSTAPRSDAAFAISQNHTIDLGEAIRQDLLLTVELIPLCRQDCQGLCQTCGANRNVEECTCPPFEEPSPFAALQSLFDGVESRK